MPSIDNISLGALKRTCYDKVSGREMGLPTSEYVDLNANQLTSYVFSICGDKGQPEKVKFHSISII